MVDKGEGEGEGEAPSNDLPELLELVGARVDAAHACPDTGLVAIVAYAGEKRILGVGIGPDVVGVGWLPRLPRARAGASHPLVSAMRAHLVGHRVRGAGLDATGAVWIAVAGPEGGEASISLTPKRRGAARVTAADGREIVSWPPLGAPEPDNRRPRALTARDLTAEGERLADESDQKSVARAKSALLRAVKARAAALLRRLEAVRGDLARLGEVDRLQRTGRMLLAQASRVPRGASSATLDDWETGGTIAITLDPALPAKSQAERFFAKARRYQRGEAIMKRRLDEAARALAAVSTLAAEIDALDADAAAFASALDVLSARARALGVSGAPEASVAARPRASKPGERLPYTIYRSAGGRPILVGRGAADNDALTTKHARPHDLWLHAKGLAGAHVVVPLEKGESCPPDVLVDAATLAAHFSDARGELVCDVIHVERRYVRKLSKSAPGTVKLDREKITAVRVEPPRLERLLATKEAF